MSMRRLRGMMMRTMPLMITCREFQDFIDDYLAASLPYRQRKIFDMRLRLCRECQSYLAKYQNTIALGRSAFEDPDGAVPEDVPEDLVAAILAARDPKA